MTIQNTKTQNRKRGKFISFEGGEGSGKSTQSKLLYESLLAQNLNVIHTREVGGTISAEKIREILIYDELETLSELMMVMAARYEHMVKLIVPSLLQGTWVICDRFIDSTACYQSGDSGLVIEDIFELHSNLMKMSPDFVLRYLPTIDEDDVSTKIWLESSGILPDITFLMDLSPEYAMNRAVARRDNNKFEEKDLEFHKLVYERYHHIANIYSERIHLIDCRDLSIEEVHNIVMQSLMQENTGYLGGL